MEALIDSLLIEIPVEHEFLNIDKIETVIREIINNRINEISLNFDYLNGIYFDGDYHDEYYNFIDMVYHHIHFKLFSRNIRNSIKNILFDFYRNIQPEIKKKDIENRIKELSKYIHPNLAKISAEY